MIGWLDSNAFIVTLKEGNVFNCTGKPAASPSVLHNRAPDWCAMKNIALTGIKPSGPPHLGNYLGMIKPALELVDKY